jgi:tRNA(Ile2)-agmatinylcytidine synthase
MSELLALARELDVDLLGPPRLVRLNPNIPWKTRGNAALSARFGKGEGARHRAGEVGKDPVWYYRQGRPLPLNRAILFREQAWRRVLAGSRFGEPGTDPALVAADRPLPSALYWRAVREVVPVAETRATLREHGCWWRTRGSDRGLVGAAAAIAWPGRRATWELTAYRTLGRTGTRREVDPGSVRAAARAHRSLFLCHDPRTRRLLVSPHTACPVLFGLRSTRAGPLLDARRQVVSEPVDRWVLFHTNQATGDHLTWRNGADLGSFLSARLRATVTGSPLTRTGGHVALRVRCDDGTDLDCLAFEPTKTLPKVVRSLWPGDRVVVWGSRATSPQLRLEGIRLVRLVERLGPPRAPTCLPCARGTRSMGQGRGYRCPICRRRYPPEEAVRPRLPIAFPPGEYHPTPSARRHLAPRAPE